MRLNCAHREAPNGFRNARDAADVWARINIIFAAFIDDGHAASINRTTYTPVPADQEDSE